MSKFEALFELVKCGSCKTGRFKIHIRDTKDSFEIRCNNCNLVAATKKIIFSKEGPKEDDSVKEKKEEPSEEETSENEYEGIKYL